MTFVYISECSTRDIIEDFVFTDWPPYWNMSEVRELLSGQASVEVADGGQLQANSRTAVSVTRLYISTVTSGCRAVTVTLHDGPRNQSHDLVNILTFILVTNTTVGCLPVNQPMYEIFLM